MLDLLILATEGAEGLPGTHIAAKLAVPLGIVIFCGSVFALLWSNYGAKKGALIYGSAFFGFTFMLGVFWWFGAPGTPVATGLQNFPGQPNDAYQGKWYPFEPGSERAQYFPSTNDPSNFDDIAAYIGQPGATPEDLEGDPRASFVRGDLDGAAGVIMEGVWLPADESGTVRLGADRRQRIQENAIGALEAAAGAPTVDDYERATPFITAEPAQILVTDDNGIRVAAVEFVTYANFQQPGEPEQLSLEVERGFAYAFKDPGALWFPSAVWTFVSLLLFVGFLFGLDRMEQREKSLQEEIAEAEDVAVPVGQ